MKILILPDGQNWVVDRNCEALVKSLPDIEFTVIPYTRVITEQLINLAVSFDFDLVHYFNWDIKRHKHALDVVKTPWLFSIRSHRYSPLVTTYIGRPHTYFHVVNLDLIKDFPGAYYIPNGIFDQFVPDHEFTVGYAGHTSEVARKYDGYYLIKRACADVGVQFKPALGEIPPEKMPEYYKSLDLYVCASEAEGFSTPVMECLAMNVPVISVDTGEARQWLPVEHIINRSVDDISRGIRMFYTQVPLGNYRWDKLAPQYREMYEQISHSK